MKTMSFRIVESACSSSMIEPPIFTIDTIQFFIGLAASLVMAFAGWRAYQADKGMPAASPPPPPAPPTA